MKTSYTDITEKLGNPKWWDEVGCPRYVEFEPQLINNIYADVACLQRVKCQACSTEFIVCCTWDHLKHFLEHNVDKHPFPKPEYLHYGDPPNYCCATGPTMSSELVEVLEKWVRDENHDWKQQQ